MGKRNGSVNIKQYLECSGKHGIFVRPTSVTLLKATTHSNQSSSGWTKQTTDAQKCCVTRSITERPSTSQSCPTQSIIEVQLELAEAAENHDMAALLRCVPLAMSLRIPPREQESAWQTLDFEIGSLRKSENRLQKENRSLMRELNKLKGMSCATACSSDLSEASKSCLLRKELQETQLHAALFEGMLKGDCEMTNTSHKEVLAELSSEMTLASEFLRFVEQHGEGVTRWAWRMTRPGATDFIVLVKRTNTEGMDPSMFNFHEDHDSVPNLVRVAVNDKLNEYVVESLEKLELVASRYGFHPKAGECSVAYVNQM